MEVQEKSSGRMAEKAKMFEQINAQQNKEPVKNKPKEVQVKGGKVKWNDPNPQGKKRENFGGTKHVKYDNLPKKKSLADLP